MDPRFGLDDIPCTFPEYKLRTVRPLASHWLPDRTGKTMSRYATVVPNTYVRP